MEKIHEKSLMNKTDFYAGGRCGIFIDVSSTTGNDLHGSETK